MTEQREQVEALLRARAERLDAGALFTPDFENELRAELRAEAESEASAAARPAFTLVLGGLLLAAAALTLMNRVSIATLFGRIEAQVAWLDVTGRPLGTLARSDQPEDVQPLETLLVELVPEVDGFATVLFYDAAGARQLPDDARAWPLEAGRAWTGGFDVGAYGAGASALVCLSEQSLERTAFDAAFPARLIGSVDGLVAAASAQLGVQIVVREL